MFQLHKLYFFAVVLCALLLGSFSYAQEKYTSLTIKDGLPSNYVYRALEDDHGFLWVARFDGKKFQVYTKKDGLPDNDVISLIKEKNGRIWANCFKQIPAYFDEVQNRFVCPMPKNELASMVGTLNMYLFALPDSGVMYSNISGNAVFKNKKLTKYFDFRDDFRFGLIKQNKDGSQLRTGSRINKQRVSLTFGFYHIKNDILLDSIILDKKPPKRYGYVSIDNGKYYVCDSNFKQCDIYSNLQTSPIRFKKDSLAVPEPFINLLFTDTSLYFVANSGKIYVYNKFTLKQTDVLSGDYLPNSYFDDRKGNRWISTIDKGLILYQKRVIKTLVMPTNKVRTNFLSIARTKAGDVLAGNYHGEVWELKNGKSTGHVVTKMVTARIRKVIVSGKDVFTFSEQGTFYNYKYPIYNPRGNRMHRSKTALVLNDSIIIVGTHFALDALNTRTKRIRNLSPTEIRITALAKKDQNTIYFGSLNGLYKYDFAKDSYTRLAPIDPILGDKIASLCYSNDNILWVSTAANGLIALKDDKVIRRGLSYDDQYRHMISTKIGQLWAATPNGINILNYKLTGNKISMYTRNLTVNDGLASNDVQEMLHEDGFVYATTTDGISVIPENFIVPKYNIPTFLVRMSVNQKDTILAKHYDLKYTEKSIQMQFSGADLGGHFKQLQYTVNKNVNWINLDENTLSIQLNSGEHTLQVRAVDVSGNVSTQILTLTFKVATPFWKNVWFWAAMAIIFQAAIFFIVNKRQKRRKELKLAQKLAAVQTAALEQQAFTSLMNPHFIFNALNSIQHYINVQDRQNANRYLSDFASLIRKNFEASHDSFIPLEEEVENIKLYLNLEQMRFTDHFSYKVIIDKDLEIEEWMIPTMILQPLLENALLHGIMPSKIAGKVSIHFKLQQQDLLIVITDNGIGLVNSNVLKVDTVHKSRGMELIKKRIKALNSFDSQPITIFMEPAFKNKNNPGNKISFLIPATMHHAWLTAKHS